MGHGRIVEDGGFVGLPGMFDDEVFRGGVLILCPYPQTIRTVALEIAGQIDGLPWTRWFN